MRSADVTSFALRTVTHQRLRSFLTALGIAVGIAAVVLLTSIGEGIHQFVLKEFTQFGTNIVAINPGRSTTQGTPLGILGSVRPLSLEDAAALKNSPLISESVPSFQGNAEVEAVGKQRRVTVFGTSAAMAQAFTLQVSRGQFLPPDDATAPRAFAVLGAKTAKELFGNQNPLGERLRVGGDRFRVVGVMAPKGTVLGFDMDDTVFIPAARAQELFNREGLFEIDVIYRDKSSVDEVVATIKRILIARHGSEDFTITTQQQMLDVLGSVLDILTFAVGALGGISLVVGAIGISTIMTIAVTERTSEIGLLRAIGATRRQITLLLLVEAATLSALGGLFGLLLGGGGAYLLTLFIPALPVHTPWEYLLLAESLAIGIGLLSGILPARRAARCDPVEALRAE